VNRRTKRDSTVCLRVYKEILKHYTCTGCYKWFTIGDATTEPTKCPNCGKVVKEILEDN